MVVIFRTPWTWIHSIILVVIRLFVISLFELVVLMYSNYEPWKIRGKKILFPKFISFLFVLGGVSPRI